MDSAKQDHIRLCLGCLITQTERIAHEVSRILQLGHLIIMRQNDGIPLALELSQLFREIDASPARTDAEVYTGTYH